MVLAPCCDCIPEPSVPLGRPTAMRLLNALFIVVALGACSSSIEEAVDSASTSPDSAQTRQQDPAVSENEGHSTAATTSSTAGTQSLTTVPPAPSMMDCGSQTVLGEIGDLFRSGQPTYDYTPARDVADLVERSAVVVTGTIAAVQRQQGGLETYTVFDVEDVEVLAGSDEVESFVTNSVWPFLDEPDPLGERVALDGVRFVAFLLPLDLNSAPSRWQPNVDGFAFGCDGVRAESLAGLPPDAAGLTVEAIVDQVE